MAERYGITWSASLMLQRVPQVICVFWTVWLALAGGTTAQVACNDWNTQAFFEGAKVEDISRCLSAGVDMGARTKGGWTPLHLAAAFSTAPLVVEALLEAGADVSARSEGGVTPLHSAAGSSATPSVVTELLKAGADLEGRADHGVTPLHMAAMTNTTTSVVVTLLDAGADVRARTRGIDPAPVALALINSPSISMLGLTSLFDVHGGEGHRKTGDDEGWTTLHLAAGSSKTPSVVIALLDAGADLEALAPIGFPAGLTPLHVGAWMSEAPSVVKALLDAGADPAAEAAIGPTPWHLIGDDSALKGTDVYWRLNEGRFE